MRKIKMWKKKSKEVTIKYGKDFKKQRKYKAPPMDNSKHKEI